MIKLAIVEDDQDIREGLFQYLRSQINISIDIVAGSMEEFLEKLELNKNIDVVLLDVGLPGMTGIEGIRHIKAKNPDTDILLNTVFQDNHRIFQALSAGASGYITKNTPLGTVKQAIEVIHTGGAFMTPAIARKVFDYFNPSSKNDKDEDSSLTQREQQIVRGLVDGLSYKQIAAQLSVTLETVRFHIKNIYKKMHVNSRHELVRKSMDGPMQLI